MLLSHHEFRGACSLVGLSHLLGLIKKIREGITICDSIFRHFLGAIFRVALCIVGGDGNESNTFGLVLFGQVHNGRLQVDNKGAAKGKTVILFSSINDA